MTPCDFCNVVEAFRILNPESVEYSGIEFAMHGRMAMLRARSEEGYQEIVNILYCPFCGRKLREDDALEDG